MLTIAGRPLPDAEDLVRRYCGLEWSGGDPETWAFKYFDQVPSRHPNQVDPVDVAVCAALHPRLRRDDLVYFDTASGPFEDWLASLPDNLELADADDHILQVLEQLSELAGAVSLSLLSKVAHHKRPLLVPMLDRSMIERYRPVNGLRGEAAWGQLLRALRSDLLQPENRTTLDRIVGRARDELGGAGPSALRALDIAVWMEAHR